MRELSFSADDAFGMYSEGSLTIALMIPFTRIQLLSKIFIDCDFCHNYLHTLYLFESL